MATATGSEEKSIGTRLKDLNGSGQVDRISNLPEAMVSYILSFLPTKSAVATSFLSKTWKLRGTKLTILDFDESFWISHDGGDDGGGTGPKMNFVEFVNMALLNHSAESIHKFSLKWDHHERSAYFKIWVDAAIARNVRVIDVALVTRTPVGRYDLHLPAALYSCGTLEVLKLMGDFVAKLPHLVCLPKLTALELHSVRHESAESFQKLISGCPGLQSLNIYRTDDISVYIISSPTVRNLHIKFFDPDSSDEPEGIIEQKVKINAPALQCLVLYDLAVTEYSIQGPTSVDEVELDIKDGIVGLVQSLDRLKFLNLSLRSMDGILFSRAPNQFSTSFERLTQLTLEMEPDHWSCLLNLIDCCVNLEVLDLTKVPSREISWPDPVNREICWTVPVSVPRCFSSSLRRVLFDGFYALEDDMEMLRFILEHGLRIETVTIISNSGPCWWSNSSTSCEEKLQILNKVLQLSRASPACKISFFWQGSGCPRIGEVL